MSDMLQLVVKLLKISPALELNPVHLNDKLKDIGHLLTNS